MKPCFKKANKMCNPPTVPHCPCLGVLRLFAPGPCLNPIPQGPPDSCALPALFLQADPPAHLTEHPSRPLVPPCFLSPPLYPAASALSLDVLLLLGGAWHTGHTWYTPEEAESAVHVGPLNRQI